MSRCVDLDERVTAQFYDEECEEWTMQTCTIADVLDSVCDEYTVLPSAQPSATDTNVGGNLIDRQAVVLALDRIKMRGDETWYDYYHKALDAIAKLPTVDAVPVRRGKWIEENTRPRSGLFYCSSCHRTCCDIQPTRLKGWTKRCRYAFCPNCGADMRGEQS